ncbi:MAG: 4Fe-4S binding protein [Pseudomonadota bacterium]
MTETNKATSKRRLMLCNCEATMSPDGAALGEAVQGAPVTVCENLCRKEIDLLKAALADGGEVVVACSQETAAFEEAAEDVADGGSEPARIHAIDIRDRAGWSDEGGSGTPKQIALLKEALLPAPAAPATPIVSDGVCLVYGPSETAMSAASRLSEVLGVTCMITSATDELLPPRRADFPIVTGRITSVSGSLGGFEVAVDSFAEALPGGRGGVRFDAPRDGGRSNCDIILDLSGDKALVPAPQKRDGYLRADPNDPIALEKALFDAAQLVGEFEKPLYIRFEESLCAHSRATQPGCDRCLNVCPTGAITPNGDHVAIDPMICAGCGACAAVCPTGAASYDDPPFAHLVRRMTTLAQSFRDAGGGAPRLLVHDAEHGGEMISLAARFDRGLPADVLPLEIEETATFGHAAMVSALALGFAAVDVLLGPKAEREAVLPQIALANAMSQAAACVDHALVRALEPSEPSELCDALFSDAPSPLDIQPVLPLGDQREVVRLAMTALAGDAQREASIALGHVDFPSRVPYGATLVDTDACTLCLSCVSLCPTGALEDNPDRPELRFREDACIQCGICTRACPETAITLEPRFNLADSARQSITLHAEEPFACIECGKEFGVKGTIERITEKLAGKNWMYTNSDNVRLIQMCDDCRVNAQFHAESSPFQMGSRPKVRTTEDYLRERDGSEKDGSGDA